MLVYYNPKLKNEEVPYSYRVRAILPSSKIKNSKVIDDLNEIDKSDIVVVNKKIKKQEVDILCERKINYIFDISDNKWPLQKDILNYTAERAKSITTTCDTLKNVIKNNTGKDAFVIPDPTERDEEEAKFEVTENNLVVYYGSDGNYKNVDWNYINKQLHSVHKTDLKVITNIPKEIRPHKMAPYRSQIQKLTLNERDELIKKVEKQYKKVIPWSYDIQADYVRKCSFVLLPVSSKNSDMMRSKGNNRPVDALRMGRYVICTEGVPSYNILKDFIHIGDIQQGYQWAIDNKEEVLDKIKKGQKFIRENYELNIIAKKWQNIYESII